MQETVRHPRPTLRAARAGGPPSLAGALAGAGAEGEPVARLAVEPARLELPYGAFADLRFRWTPRRRARGRRGIAPGLRPPPGLRRRPGPDLRPRPRSGAWRVGEQTAYDARVYQSLLAPPLPPGTYALTAGLYDPPPARAGPSIPTGEAVGRNEYRVATFEVPVSSGEGAGVPAVLFGPAWSPTLARSRPAGDRLPLALRGGTIRLGDLPGAGTLWLSLGVPEEQAGSLRRRIVDPPGGGDGVPRVDVMVSCSGFEAQVSGDGTHGVEVPLEPSEARCEITLDPNYVLVSPNDDRRTLVLQVLAWRPAET